MKFIKPVFLFLLLAAASCQSPPDQPIEDPGSKIVFKDEHGNVITASELESFTGTVDYEIADGKTIDPAANALHQEARTLGHEGKYIEAIAKLKEAIAIQPDWAYPPYDLAYTYLLKGDFDSALVYYKKTDALEPKGFFTCKTALYTLEGEKSGTFPKGMYLMYLQIEWTDDPAKKLEIAKTLTENIPAYAPGWKELAVLLDDNTKSLEAIEKGLSKNPDAETHGILVLNKAAILNQQGKTDEAKALLGNLIFAPGTTTANVELAKTTLKSIVKTNP